MFIRARQGRSVNADPTSLYIHKITAEEAENLNPVVHGTAFANQRSIESSGLIPGGTSGTVYRAAVHFLACGLAKDNASEAAMSSLRQRGEVFYILDLKAYITDGGAAWLSGNGVVNIHATVKPCYLK